MRVDADGLQKPFKDRLPIRKRGRLTYIPVEQVDWIQARRNYLYIHRGNDAYSVRMTLSSMEAGLNPDRFVRIHRSTIVNIDRVKALRPLVRGRHLIELYNGSTLPLSRGYRQKMSLRIRTMQRSGMNGG